MVFLIVQQCKWKHLIDQHYLIDEDALFAKEIEMELEQCNDVTPSNEEKDVNYEQWMVLDWLSSFFIGIFYMWVFNLLSINILIHNFIFIHHLHKLITFGDMIICNNFSIIFSLDGKCSCQSFYWFSLEMTCVNDIYRTLSYWVELDDEGTKDCANLIETFECTY